MQVVIIVNTHRTMNSEAYNDVMKMPYTKGLSSLSTVGLCTLQNFSVSEIIRLYE